METESSGADILKCGLCDYKTSDLAAFVGHKKSHDMKKKCPACDFTSDNLQGWIHQSSFFEFVDRFPPVCFELRITFNF